MAKGPVKPPWDEEVLIWETLFVKNEPLTRWVKNQQKFTEYRLRKSKKRFLSLTFAEWSLLPPHLKPVHPRLQEYQTEVNKRRPTTPLQEDAYALCTRGDHSWLGENRFEGQAYTSEYMPEESERVIGLVWVKRTCWFCAEAKEFLC